MKIFFENSPKFKCRTLENPKSRFLKYVKKTKGCWLWTGSVLKSGYGQFTVRLGEYKRQNWRAHRISLVLHGKQIPGNYEVCHTCDIRLCVKPSHLFVGTKSENMLDSSIKGRMSECHARLKAKDVRLIRAIKTLKHGQQKELSERFNVHPHTIYRVRKFKTWANFH